MNEKDELRMLRSRAYGPASDIHTDPQALARLEELEPAQRQAEMPDAEAPAARDAGASGDASEPRQPDAPDREPRESDPPPAAPRSRRWVAILWFVSVLAALAVGAAIASALMPLVSRGAGAVQMATLQPHPAFPWPENYLGPETEDATGYQDFFGLTAITAKSGPWLPEGTDTCILVMPTTDLRDGGALTGGSQYGCGAGAFPATVVVTVGTELPEELRGRFPLGSALQFVFDGERVGVFTDAPE